MIVFNNWQISVIGLVARQYDNLSRRIDVEGDLPDGYTWQLLVQSGGNADTLLLQPTEKGVGAVLTADNLSKSGEYYFQLRGILEADGVTKRHTNVVSAYIPESLTGLGSWPEVPTEFSQVEARILELYQHPPIPGSNGYWLVWDADKDEYVESQLSLPEAAAGGTSDHSKLKNRDAADQHPMSAIAGLEKALEGKQAAGIYLTDKDLDATLTVEGKAADAKAVGDALSTLSEEIANLQTSGLTTAQVKALDGMFKVAAYIKADVSAEYSAFKTAFGITEPEKTLTSISATYSGGDVAVGTAVTDLTGIVVTAHYSDGTSATVTGYTLSGTIAEGNNTITVTYQGKTATFTVTGVTGSGNVSDDTQWTNGVAYKYTVVADEYVSTPDGSFVSYSGWCRTPYLKCDGASKLRAIAKVESSTLLTTGSNTSYNAFYDENKSFIQSFSFLFASGYAVGDFIDIAVPENAVYFILSAPNTSIGTNNSSGKPIVDFIPYA